MKILCDAFSHFDVMHAQVKRTNIMSSQIVIAANIAISRFLAIGVFPPVQNSK